MRTLKMQKNQSCAAREFSKYIARILEKYSENLTPLVVSACTRRNVGDILILKKTHCYKQLLAAVPNENLSFLFAPLSGCSHCWCKNLSGLCKNYLGIGPPLSFYVFLLKKLFWIMQNWFNPIFMYYGALLNLMGSSMDLSKTHQPVRHFILHLPIITCGWWKWVVIFSERKILRRYLASFSQHSKWRRRRPP